MLDITKELSEIERLITKLQNVHNMPELLLIKKELLGNGGKIDVILQQLKIIPEEHRAKLGQTINQKKAQISLVLREKIPLLTIISSTGHEVTGKDEESYVSSSKAVFDNIMFPLISSNAGHIHLFTYFVDKIYAWFGKEGALLTQSPQIDEQHYNFDVLNIPKLHPSRLMHDTFYLDDNHACLLRTHTSNAQGRLLQLLCCLAREKSCINDCAGHGLGANVDDESSRAQSLNCLEQYPTKVFTIGQVYRADDEDATHLAAFHQIEYLVLGLNATVSELKNIIFRFLKEIFNIDSCNIKFRHSYFPFTEPSFEVDIYHNNKWLEVLGCGLMHQNVLKNSGWRCSCGGIAIGFGVERLLTIFYNICDVRGIFSYHVDSDGTNNIPWAYCMK